MTFNLKANCLTNWFLCISKIILKNILFSQVKIICSICKTEDLKIALENLERILLVNYYQSYLINDCSQLDLFKTSFFGVVCSGKI